MVIDLQIGSVVLPIAQALGFEQTYQELGGRAILINALGGAIERNSWRKLETTISGRGNLPPVMAAIALGGEYLVKCAAQRAAGGTASNVITVPAARRSDRAPIGYGIVGTGQVRTPISWAGNVATLTAVAGASSYQVSWWPQFTALITDRDENTPLGRGEFGWRITLREI